MLFYIMTANNAPANGKHLVIVPVGLRTGTGEPCYMDWATVLPCREYTQAFF